MQRLGPSRVLADWGGWLLVNWPIVVTLFASVRGGTAVISSGAQGATNAGANPDNMLVPVTNSK